MNLQRIPSRYILVTFFGSTALSTIGLYLVPAVLGHVLFWVGIAGLAAAALTAKRRGASK